MKKFRMKAKSCLGILVLLLVIVSIGAPVVSVEADNYTVTKDWVIDNLENPDVVFLDTRSLAEYMGLDVRAARGGHVPGAVNIEWTYCYDYSGSYKPDDELRKIFETAGVTPDEIVVTYCQAGYRAKAVYDTLLMLDYSQVFVYEGSWAEWGNDPKTPIETTCTLALVGGPKNNTGAEGCSSCGSISEMYVYVSELTGTDRLLAVGSALSNSDVTLLMDNFIGMGIIPRGSKANAVKIIYENDEGGFSEGTIVAIPCKPVTPENENVTHAEIYFASGEPTVARAAKEEIIDGKTWLTVYYVNQTTGQVESVTVERTRACNYWCLVRCAFTHPQIWGACTLFCVCAYAAPWLCLVPCVICIIGLGAKSAICTDQCCW